MKSEIICIGSELLLGEIVNTNAAFISDKLTKLGINCHFQTTVGDNESRIYDALNIAINRADLIITTGGLGPTDDDLTIKAIANYFNEEMVFDETSLQNIIKYFEKRGQNVVEINKNQALRPKTAEHFKNSCGTAPGMFWKLDAQRFGFKKNKYIVSFPGVPSELYSMWNEASEKYFSNFTKSAIAVKRLKFTGIAEAVLADKVKSFLELSNPTVAPLVSDYEATLRVAAKAESITKANDLILETKAQILKEVGDYYYGDDEDTLESVVAKILNKKNITVSIAESCTGGLVSSRLTDIAGSSAFITLNVVTYSNEAKQKIINVKAETLEKYGAVSEQTAKEMAQGIKKLSNSDVGLSLTGIAGPAGGSDEKPVGLVYIGISADQITEVHKVQVFQTAKNNRINTKRKFSTNALNLLRKFLLENF